MKPLQHPRLASPLLPGHLAVVLPCRLMQGGGRDAADEVQGDGVADERFMNWIIEAVISLDGFQRIVESSFGLTP